MRQLNLRFWGERFGWAIVLALVLFRSAVFVFRPQFAFDSDQAVWGLMAKHIAEGRAFPVFMYGEHYFLAVEAWITAPVFVVAGVSAVALKIPMLAINVAAALLLLRLLCRDAGLDALSAIVASLFFTLAPPGTTEALMEVSGGTAEPLLYVLLLWMTRRRPAWCGFVLGIGFLQREFTVYGAAALAMIGIAEGGWHRKDEWLRAGRILRVAAEVWLVVHLLRQFATPYGPGTSTAAEPAGNNIAGAVQRFCFDPRLALTGLGRLVTVHWPRLFGTERLPIAAFGAESAVMQGVPWSGALLAAAMLLMAVRVAVHWRADEAARRRCDFCAYAVLAGTLSAVVFAVGRCGNLTVMRYDILSLLGAVGLAAWALAVETRPWVRRLEIAVILAWAIASATAHGAVWAEQLRHPRVPDKELIIRSLDARGVRFATSDYWIAYYVTFLTNERIVVASDDLVRIFAYQEQVAAHRRDAIRISRTPCGDGKPVIDGVYFCSLP